MCSNHTNRWTPFSNVMDVNQSQWAEWNPTPPHPTLHLKLSLTWGAGMAQKACLLLPGGVCRHGVVGQGVSRAVRRPLLAGLWETRRHFGGGAGDCGMWSLFCICYYLNHSWVNHTTHQYRYAGFFHQSLCIFTVKQCLASKLLAYTVLFNLSVAVVVFLCRSKACKQWQRLQLINQTNLKQTLGFKDPPVKRRKYTNARVWLWVCWALNKCSKNGLSLQCLIIGYLLFGCRWQSF